MLLRSLIVLFLMIIFVACSSSKTLRKKNQIRLPVIHFGFNSSSINTHEMFYLKDSIAALNKASKDSTIVINGHTDRIGTEKYNENLGLKRALAVKKVLMDLGISPDHISTRSYGENAPLIRATDSYLRSKNRRATIEIVPAIEIIPITAILMKQ